MSLWLANSSASQVRHPLLSRDVHVIFPNLGYNGSMIVCPLRDPKRYAATVLVSWMDDAEKTCLRPLLLVICTASRSH